MADLEFDEFEGEYGAPYAPGDGRFDRAKRLANISGAVCSVALVLGLGLWGYQLAVRDVAGVPVMRALVGPMRIAPADPGGNEASNQGLSVNAIAATGTAQPMSDQLTLAPRPTELKVDDGTGLQNAADAGEIAVIEASLQITSSATPATAALTDTLSLDDGVPPLVEDALAEAPLDEAAVVEDGTAEGVDPFNGNLQAVAVSLRPRARPAALTESAGTESAGTGSGVTGSGVTRSGVTEAASKPANVQNVSAPGPVTELDPSKIQIGTRLAQLGAFDTPDLARARFAELQMTFGELMAGKSIVITSAQSGGRTFYRLRAVGFEGDDDARRFCAVLESDNVDCIPVAQR